MDIKLSPLQYDRALGVIIGSAGGDALGSQYEFGPKHSDEFHPKFGVGIFGHGVGEWTDDTSMAIPILEWVAAKGELPHRHILERWIEWSEDAKDVGMLTRTVLNRLKPNYERLEYVASQEARNIHQFNGKTAGNGALMRIGPYALHELDSPLDLETLSSIVRWTHYDEDNVTACALWIDAIRDSMLTGEYSMEKSLNAIAPTDKDRWGDLIAEAEAKSTHPRDYASNNGWVVSAFQAALSAVTLSETLEDAVEIAIRGGGDTDTVAAITGSLAGAVYGASAVPAKWTTLLHGWPGYTLRELDELVVAAVEPTSTSQ